MAYTATNSGIAAHQPIAARIISALGRFAENYVDARSRRSEFEALERLTDDQLAARGLSRDTIARHVFSDTFYL